MGIDWKFDSSVDASSKQEHPIGIEECQQECARRGCTAFSVSVALNLCRFSYDDSCTTDSLEGVEDDITKILPTGDDTNCENMKALYDSDYDTYPRIIGNGCEGVLEFFGYHHIDHVKLYTDIRGKTDTSEGVSLRQGYKDNFFICNHDRLYIDGNVHTIPCEGRADGVRVGSGFSEVEIFRKPTWKSYSMERNIQKVGNYTGETRLMETIWDESNPKCRCYTSENELPFVGNPASSLFTVYAGEYVPTWDQSLFYKRENKNPFVCNYESYSDYSSTMNSETCGCGDEIALVKTVNIFGTPNSRTMTYSGSSTPGRTIEENYNTVRNLA